MYYSNALLLSHFVALIQFLTGVYLLFLYERVLHRNPLLTQLRLFEYTVLDFLKQYQNYAVDSELKNLNTSFEREWRKDWKMLKQTFTLLFIYSGVLLIHCGYETYCLEEHTLFYGGIFMCSLLIFIYIIACYFFNKKEPNNPSKVRFLHPIWWFVILVVVIHFSRWVNEFFLQNGYRIIDHEPISSITIFTIWILLFGFIVIILKSLIYYIRLRKCSRKIRQLSETIDFIISIRIHQKDSQPTKASNKNIHSQLNAVQYLSENIEKESLDVKDIFDKGIKLLVNREAREIEKIITERYFFGILR